MCIGDCGDGFDEKDYPIDKCIICKETVEQCRENLTATGLYIHPECRPKETPMTIEEQDEKEFEEEWKRNDHKPIGYVPLVFLDALKNMSKQYWLASRRTLREKLLKLNNHPKDAKYG